jgi:hypothetical protein
MGAIQSTYLQWHHLASGDGSKAGAFHRPCELTRSTQIEKTGCSLPEVSSLTALATVDLDHRHNVTDEGLHSSPSTLHA